MGTKLIKRQSATVLCGLAAFLVSDYCRRRGGWCGRCSTTQHRGIVASASVLRVISTSSSRRRHQRLATSSPAYGNPYSSSFSKNPYPSTSIPRLPLSIRSVSAGIHIFDINKQASSPFYLHSWVWKSLLIRTTTHALIKPFLELTEISC